jgi:hypothetical protein
VRATRGELNALSNMLSRSFFTHIKVPQSVVFAARAGDTPADDALAIDAILSNHGRAAS